MIDVILFLHLTSLFYLVLLPGTLQLSKNSWQVFDPRIPSLSNLGPVENPSNPYKIISFIPSFPPHHSYLFDQEGSDSLWASLWFCLCIDNQDISIRTIRDPKLITIQNIVISLLLSTQLHTDDV